MSPAMTPANDAFTLNNRYSSSHHHYSNGRAVRSPSPVSMGLGKLARRNTGGVRTALQGRRQRTTSGGLDEIGEEGEKTAAAAAAGVVGTRAVDWEVPRKTLHASIGFFVVPLYTHGYTAGPVIVCLTGALAVISAAEVMRLHNERFERVYEACLGPLMRDSEKHKINGVVWYIIGVLIVLSTMPLDIAVVSILILSWADTAASMFGRLWGRLTPALPSRIPLVPFVPAVSLPLARRKSWAGFVAAAVTAGGVACGFWGWLAPLRGTEASWGWGAGVLGGRVGLGVVSVVTGLTAGVAEALDVGSLDDNLTLPVVCGGVLSLFLKGMLQ